MDFIGEFNKYGIYNITVELHRELLNCGTKKLSFDKLTSILNRQFIVYKNTHFMYDKKLLDKFKIIIYNSNRFEFFQQTNYIIQYIYQEYKKTNNDNILESIIIPKYYDELMKQKIKTHAKPIAPKIPKTISISVSQSIDDTKTKAPTVTPQKKKTIPLSLKRNVWNKHIGESIGKTLCLCCKLTQITQMNFSCGHIVSEFNGGTLKLDNLKPICVSCNSSMGTQNMDEFIEQYGL